MSKKLYRVVCELEIYVFADAKPGRYDVNKYTEREALDHGFEPTSVKEVTSLRSVPEEWRESVPYGGSKTVSEILKGGSNE